MNDSLCFFSSSADKYPGKGTNEYVSIPSLYRELSSIKDWRRILSNFHVCNIVYKGLTYRTLEHAWQGLKIGIADPDKGYLFSLESGSTLSKGDGNEARKNRKMIVLSNTQLEVWYSSNTEKELLLAKFSQDDMCKKVLLLTLESELWHSAPRTPKKRQFLLEEVRRSL
jgi:predicted NAD-dependent protein-ADP-ribosyltransferase YbiA (DUF1768 family)